ncbi:N-acyl-D-amino-acid deacylase family protein [Fictibacillus phosphorivorans]|uniref:N-acyl-D-amino-acid deacylase family protein n=1 Tax=Fictibacillus phosphorivorans TaxID=1221500 RepID=UPI00203E8CF3|nr:D-aminoacylase [Fictibacillus phosphorivorans]MCM3718555.1 D-aminoacylase [Fictibacillus phosphorivorans]MCM3776089.1 D-aminoacylase [Fictibacillus phosphorivorans]
MYDLIIKNGKIIDGTGSPWYYADIGIKENKITNIGCLKYESAEVVIDAERNIVSPGFIDMHTHSDLVILEEPLIKAKVMQGITTDLLGQDGIAAAPLPPQFREVWKKNLAGLDGTPAIDWDWLDVDSYLTKIENNKPSYNLAFLVPHGNIRMTVMGLDNRPATDEEIQQMKEVLRDSLDQGAVGLSTGLIYPPCCFAEMKELEALCEVIAEYEVPLVIHQRSEGDEILESMQELVGIMRRTGAHLHFSHLKNCGKDNWHKTDDVLKIIDSARKEGIEVTFDQYPYTAGSTMLSAILPPWAHDGGTEKMLARLEDQALRKQIKDEMKAGLKGWDSISKWAGWQGIFITSVGSKANQSFVGKNLDEIARLKNSKDVASVALDLILEEKNAVGMIDFVMDEDSVKKIMAHPAGTIGSDGLLGGEPHPRAYGSFPRVLGKYVREEGVLKLEEMIRRMTSQPARIIGLQDRGILREGLAADIVIFNPEEVIDKATYENSRQAPEGIYYVIVNGQVIKDIKGIYEKPSGKVIRRKYHNITVQPN